MDSESGGGFGCGLIVAIIIISLFWGIGKAGKYEGQTAEEWFNDYDEVSANLEELVTCLRDLPTGNYKSYDTFSLTSDIEDCIGFY
jgi:hypothetical protein